MSTTSKNCTALLPTVDDSAGEHQRASLYGPTGPGCSMRSERPELDPAQSRRTKEATTPGEGRVSFQALLAAGPTPRSNGRTCKVCAFLAELDGANAAALREMIADRHWTRQAIADAASTWGTSITRNMVSQHERAGHDKRAGCAR